MGRLRKRSEVKALAVSAPSLLHHCFDSVPIPLPTGTALSQPQVSEGIYFLFLLLPLYFSEMFHHPLSVPFTFSPLSTLLNSLR